MSAGFHQPGLNSCSLEHSYTNLFALTELNGIQYRKYTLKRDSPKTTTINDPILTAYAYCQSEGILAAWVRTKTDSTNSSKPYLFSNYSKELYIFWYDQRSFAHEEKSIFRDLTFESSGNWRTGLSYEVRTMLFKALHNLIEKYALPSFDLAILNRSLLSKGFVRIGKWFLNTARFSTEDDE
ncbi:hypothetical protein Ciccas_001929 [Cichlidogyrus casuarinus]|uniref:Mediator of RNA polymerase II transcription subunit 13 n=1 Tax=Cichlidogyrus casuarinus TaxID=1844966 RepID=A0ABD2QIS7_9PLAT